MTGGSHVANGLADPVSMGVTMPYVTTAASNAVTAARLPHTLTRRLTPVEYGESTRSTNSAPVTCRLGARPSRYALRSSSDHLAHSRLSHPIQMASVPDVVTLTQFEGSTREP